MIKRRAQRHRGSQDPRPPHRARDRPRRRDGQRHLRPHRHDLEGLRRHLQRVLRGHGRRHQRQAARRLLLERAGDRLRRPARQGEGAARGAGGGGRHLRPAVELQPGEARRTRTARRSAAPAAHRPSGSASTPASSASARSSSPRAGGRRGRDEVVIDAGTASKQDLGPGDSVGVAALGPVEHYRIVGVTKFGSVDSIGGATIAVFDLPTAQALYDKQGRFDVISVAAKDGVTPQKLVREIAPLLPASAQVQDGRRAGGGRREGHERGPQLHHQVPARLRRDRALRRLVRHLQHALDHGRATHARVRHPAYARRLPAPGAARGHPRGLRPRPAGLADRTLPRASASARASTRSSSPSVSTCPRPGPCSRRGRSSSACSPGRS